MFDSGVGGLSVLRHLEQVMRQTPGHAPCRFIYVGDTARCPYGDRDPHEIIIFVKQIVDWLIYAGADQIIMACNTSAAAAGNLIRARSPVPVHDLIQPAAEYVARVSDNVAVLATSSTVRSNAFSKAITRINPSARVSEIGCPELVPLVEAGKSNSASARDAVWKYVKDFESNNVTSVVLGCTHFPFLRAQLERLLPPEIALVDPAEHLSLPLERVAQADFDPLPAGASAKFFVTGSVERFAQTAAMFLGRSLADIAQLPLEELIDATAVKDGSGTIISAGTVLPAVSPSFP